jgi:hypothetical protein
MNGMTGRSGTLSLPFAIVIFSPPAGIAKAAGFASDMHWLL